jgi:hypothetical protein
MRDGIRAASADFTCTRYTTVVLLPPEAPISAATLSYALMKSALSAGGSPPQSDAPEHAARIDGRVIAARSGEL